jgi:HlyD family secretion protein
MKIRKKFLPLVLLVCGACSSDEGYLTAQVEQRDITAICTATGTINPVTTVEVGTQVSGRVKALYADYNSPVKSGQLIAEIDPAAFEAQREQARANLLAARASLQQAVANRKDSRRNFKRTQELHAGDVVGQSELDTAETKLSVAESQVGVARAQIVQAQAAFDLAETNLRYTKISCPIDGIVIARRVDIGQTVAAAFQTPTLFVVAEDLTRMRINTSVDEADIGRVAVDQQVHFSVDAYPGNIFEAQVLQIRNDPQITQNVVTYDVLIDVDNSDLKLKPGMTANVEIISDRREQVVCVPDAALRFKPEEEPPYAGSFVWVPGDKAPRRIAVKTGISDYSYSELLEGDLQPGQEVIIGQQSKR